MSQSGADPQTEPAFVNLLRHMEWQSDGFSLVFLFADVGPSQRLLQWLDEQSAHLGKRIRVVPAPGDFSTDPEKAVDALMEVCTSPPEGEQAIWYALQQQPSDADWNRARRLFLARLNERRYLLERDMRCPLVLVLPPDFKSEARAIAPDIWHVRALSEELRADTSVITGRGRATVAMPLGSAAGTVHSPEVLLVASPPVDELKTPAYDDWRRIVTRGAGTQEYLPTAWRAVQELVDRRRLDEAEDVARAAESLARSRVVPAVPATLRDLSITLDHAAQVARARVDLERARALCEESLGLSRELVGRFPESWSAARDLSIALDQVGQIALDSNDWDRAEQAFSESLEISRHLWAGRRQESSAVRELALAIDQRAQLSWRRGDLEKASDLFKESLGLSRMLLSKGDHPEALRDLSIALEQVGGVEAARGNLSEAERAFRECLELRRRIANDAPNSTQAVYDLAFALEQLGEIAQAQGDTARAAEAFSEGLSLDRRLIELTGGTRQAKEDLAIELMRVVRSATGLSSEREEAVAIIESLQATYPDDERYRHWLAELRRGTQ